MPDQRPSEVALANMLRNVTRAGRAYEESTNTTDVALGSLRVQRRVQLNILLSDAEGVLWAWERSHRNEIPEDEIRVDVFRTAVPFPQENAVRLTHIPTGIVVSWGEERSQTQNKSVAMAILRYKVRKRYGIDTP